MEEVLKVDNFITHLLHFLILLLLILVTLFNFLLHPIRLIKLLFLYIYFIIFLARYFLFLHFLIFSESVNNLYDLALFFNKFKKFSHILPLLFLPLAMLHTFSFLIMLLAYYLNIIML